MKLKISPDWEVDGPGEVSNIFYIKMDGRIVGHLYRLGLPDADRLAISRVPEMLALLVELDNRHPHTPPPEGLPRAATLWPIVQQARALLEGLVEDDKAQAGEG